MLSTVRWEVGFRAHPALRNPVPWVEIQLVDRLDVQEVPMARRVDAVAPYLAPHNLQEDLLPRLGPRRETLGVERRESLSRPPHCQDALSNECCLAGGSLRSSMDQGSQLTRGAGSDPVHAQAFNQ